MSKQRHLQLENISNRTVLRLQQIAGAYRLGNITKPTAMQKAEKTLTQSFNEILLYTKKVPVKRDLGEKAKPLTEADDKKLRLEIDRKLVDFGKVLDDIK